MSDAALDVEGLHAGYGGRRVLAGVDLRVERGEWLALLGANGSGKSTLLDCCVGRLQPSAGRVRVDGRSLAEAAAAAKRALGYATAPERLPPLLSARECLAVQAAAKRLAQVDADVLALADELGLSPWLDDAVALMSYGTRQKLGVLVALLGEPALVVLDESLNGLDSAAGLGLKRHLRARVEAGRCGV
ncbi:MAG TPA: ABC transporter ATP-binding protein, partial [Dokdonella sp.]